MFGLSRARTERRVASLDATTAALMQRRQVSYSTLTASYADMLTVPAVEKSLRLTAGAISVMPIDAFRADGGPGAEVATRPRLLREPSARVPLEVWLHQAVESMIMHGDVFGQIVSRDARDAPTQIELVDPTQVEVRVKDGRLTWRFDRKLVEADDVWHVVGRPQRSGSMFGIGLIETMASTVGVTLAARKYESQWFEDGAHPTSIIRPSIDPGKEGAEALKARVLAITRGNREPLILPPNTDFETLQENPVTSALLEALKENAADIAHFFSIPPELVGGSSGDSMTYSNVESRILDLLAFGVQFWMVKIERALERAFPGEPFTVKLREGGFVRTDMKTKVETLAMQVSGGLMTPNEGRKLLDLPPLPGGDQLIVGKGLLAAKAEGAAA